VAEAGVTDWCNIIGPSLEPIKEAHALHDRKFGLPLGTSRPALATSRRCALPDATAIRVRTPEWEQALVIDFQRAVLKRAAQMSPTFRRIIDPQCGTGRLRAADALVRVRSVEGEPGRGGATAPPFQRSGLGSREGDLPEHPVEFVEAGAQEQERWALEQLVQLSREPGLGCTVGCPSAGAVAGRRCAAAESTSALSKKGVRNGPRVHRG
jgi:hypothetical protein